MTKEIKGITVGTPVVEKVDDLPRVRVYIPKLEDEGGMKTDPYEHVTINDETTLVRRGEYVDVTVPVFLQLRNKFPHI